MPIETSKNIVRNLKFSVLIKALKSNPQRSLSCMADEHETHARPYCIFTYTNLHIRLFTISSSSVYENDNIRRLVLH